MPKSRRTHDSVDDPLGDFEQCAENFKTVRDGGFGQRKADEQLEHRLGPFEFRKTSAGFHDPHHEKQHQQRIGDGPQGAVDAENDIPNGAAPEVLRGGSDELPDLCEFLVPCGERRVEGVDDKVVDGGSPPSRGNGTSTTGDKGQDFLGEGDNNAACHGQHTIGPLGGIMGLEGKANLQDAKAQQNQADSTDQAEK